MTIHDLPQPCFALTCQASNHKHLIELLVWRRLLTSLYLTGTDVSGQDATLCFQVTLRVTLSVK